MYDCHIHSKFSTDSETDAVSACNYATSHGLQGITFTDHLDFDYPGYTDEFQIDFDKYDRYMDNLKSCFKSKIKVFKGIEAGFQPHVIKKTLDVINNHVFDYVLASVHIIDGIDPYLKEYYTGKPKMHAYERYLQEIIYMIDRIDNFDIWGHLDYIIRYADYTNRSMHYKDHADLFDGIFTRLIKKGKGFEVNTASYRELEGIVTPVYDFNILKRYKELGGEILTLGSDAHTERYIGYGFKYFSSLLKKAGFKYAAYYEDRKPVFYII